MSQDSRRKKGTERDVSHLPLANGELKNYEGFEGMNYEQFRQPYNPKHTNRNEGTDERKDRKRPDEG